ncbi:MULTISPECIES: alkaline ceramidase [unclassified Luteococcus]|uniref:alkaline ceramidase n=1 Tax=unclassified Luteococcus TaxID=2639923 RepID=UPI00313DDEAD
MNATTVGIAVVEVNVPTGTPMSGFAARTEGSTGVHDPTSVRALVIGGHGIVAVDVCALHEDTCHEIAGRSGLASVTVSATHTHSGPCISRGRVGRHNPEVHAAVVSAAVEALDAATEGAQPVTVEYREATGVGVARDRRHLERPVDPPLQAVCFHAGDQMVAAIVSYPCHPVVLDGTNTLITGDYVHFLRVSLEEEWGGQVLFLNGTAGDLNTGHTAESSYEPGKDPARTFARAEQIGTTLAEALAASTPRAVGQLTTGFACADVSLDFSDLPEDELSGEVSGWRSQRTAAPPGTAALLDIWLDWADRWPRAARQQTTQWAARVSCLRIGELWLVTLPGEPFFGVAEAIRRAASLPVVVAGYTDGVPGYIPMEQDYADGGYEVCDAHRYYDMPAPFAVGSAERLVQAAIQLMED